MRDYVVYRIENAANSKLYFGITCRSAKKRFAQHCANARRGVPGKLYNAMRKHGVERFCVFVVLETLTQEEALQAEIDLIATNNSLREGYNASPGGDVTFELALLDENDRKVVVERRADGVRRWAESRSDEEIEILRQRVSQQWASLDPEKRQATTKKMASRKARRYVVTSPDGQIFDVVDLKAFCKERGLHQGQLCGVANGRYKHCKNWTARHFDK